ncbi:hypothetical protein Dimus_038651 [Dionaea muscipula]
MHLWSMLETLPYKLWKDIVDFGRACDKPWIVAGDFNAYMFSHEKVGHDQFINQPCVDLLNCCLRAGLEDLKGAGCLHTWSKNQGLESWLRVKLDRAMGNPNWFEAFDTTEAVFLEAGISDRLLLMWQKIVRHGWQEEVKGHLMFQVVQKLKRLKKPLKALHAANFSDLDRRISKVRESIFQAQADLSRGFSVERKERATEESKGLCQLLIAEDLFLKQRVKGD